MSRIRISAYIGDAAALTQNIRAAVYLAFTLPITERPGSMHMATTLSLTDRLYITVTLVVYNNTKIKLQINF